MIFGNIGSIVTDHYSSLGEETGLKTPFDYVFLVIVFGIIPSVIGYTLANYVIIWSGFIAASAPVLSVLTGFSINTIVLLMRYDKDGSHPYEEKTVRKTKEFTLYTILAGVLLITCLMFGYIISRINGVASLEVAFFVSGLVYSLLAHYFLTLFVITHRLWSLIHGDVI
ncbi:hypothetical protein [Halorussus lipolyticus]|uniref:hypothetical protein n=1 Tax=Halorussus lipolyticus TaxID=3034024 RepID=UPI0023E7629B|nr:hypothetical protein [Halorussus sp. DT80]